MKKRIGNVLILCCFSALLCLHADSMTRNEKASLTMAASATTAATATTVTTAATAATDTQDLPAAPGPIWEDAIWQEVVIPEPSLEETTPETQPELNEENDIRDESEYVDFAIADVTRYVNVRSLPSTEGEIVGKIYDGSVAQVLEIVTEPEEWFQIVSGNVEGYVKGEFFVHGEEAAEVMDDYVTHNILVKADKLNVRAGQSTGSDRIGYLLQDEKAKLLEDCGDWLRIQYTEDKEGYVSAEYVIVLEEYIYAMTPEEESEAADTYKQRRERQQSLQKNNITIVENLVPPSTTYTSNEELRTEIVNYALQFVGNKYVNGGKSLTTGTDCSGFTCFIYADFGYSISRTPSGQFTGDGRSIDYSEIQPGDIVCYSSNGGKSCTHVALYIGNGQIVHSANSRKGVITSGVEFEPIIGFKNVID